MAGKSQVHKPALPNLGEPTLQGEESWLLEVLPLPTLIPLVEQLPPLRILLVSTARSVLLGGSSVHVTSEISELVSSLIDESHCRQKL